MSEARVTRESIVEGLRHPRAPHVEALLSARSALTAVRDNFEKEPDEASEAAAAIGEIDAALEWLGYRHFTQGGVRWDQRTESVAAAGAFLKGD